MGAAASVPGVPGGGREELDEGTLARASRGERAACVRFVAFYERLVFGVVGRVVGPRALPGRVEELAQDTFVRALRALPRFDPRGSARLSTWLLTIATRIALNDLRRKQPTVVPLTAVSDPAAPDEYARLHMRGALEAAIAELTPEQRAVLVLHDLHGLRDSEVAEALRMGIPAVKSRLFRARARMRRALREDENG